MLDKKSLAVLKYLKNHFSCSNESISSVNIHIKGLSTADINTSLKILDEKGYIKINDKYINKPVVGLNTI